LRCRCLASSRFEDQPAAIGLWAIAALPVRLPGGGAQADLRIDLPEGRYSIQWVDTKTGRVIQPDTLAHAGGVATLRSPGYEADIALAVRALP